MKGFGKFLVLALLAVITIVSSLHPQKAPIKSDLQFQAVMGVLGGIFVIVLLVERATEIAISIWRQSGSDPLKERIGLLMKDPAKSVELSEVTTELSKYQAETKNIALLIGFSISVIVCSAGVGLLTTIIDDNEANKGFLRGIDILLTSGLIAGGSDGFHQFVSALETFFTESKRHMETKP